LSTAAAAAILPWTGPINNGAGVLHIPPVNLLVSLIKVQLAGLAFVFIVALIMGKGEESTGEC
jgi:citrate-Mg2+:H+ or citrate-Ca2+:H+ symporter, CitMHS family